MNAFIIVFLVGIIQAGGVVMERDSCGDPLTVNQIYILCTGTVVAVDNGNSLKVDLDKECTVDSGGKTKHFKGRISVQLVQLETPPLNSPLGQISKAALSSNLLGKKIDLLPSPYQRGRQMVAMVHGPLRFDSNKTKGFESFDQGIAQLEAGLAFYKDYGPYALDWYRNCVYKRAENDAKQARLGVWAEKGRPQR
jgi:endonuclease YncB( thermonuclease family)